MTLLNPCSHAVARFLTQNNIKPRPKVFGVFIITAGAYMLSKVGA